MNEADRYSRSGRSFSDRWIEYCVAYKIPFKRVDCLGSDIISELKGCSGLMWHFAQNRVEDMLIAHAVVKAAEMMGVKVFPNSSTSWHFDDKVAQKYLMEAVGVPCVPSFVFLDSDQALRWAMQTDYPKVFKLRGGASSSNVRLVRSASEATRLIRRAFASGFSPVPRWHALKERWWQFRRDRTIRSFIDISRGLVRAIRVNPQLARLSRQRYYAYFQNFVPGNDSDIRVIVIGKRAFAIKRMVRGGDFRASGSGAIIYDPGEIPARCVELAFEIADALASQSLALDFVFYNDQPLVVEMSYAFKSSAYQKCPGYWRRDGGWVATSFRAEDFMLEDFLESMSSSSA